MVAKRRTRPSASWIGLLFLGGGLYFCFHALPHGGWSQAREHLRHLPAQAFFVACALELCVWLMLLLYERLAFEALGRSISWRRLFVGSFLANAFGNTLGFPTLTGSALRWRLYSAWGLSGWEVAEVCVLTYLPATLGLLTLCGFFFALLPLPVPFLHLPGAALRAGGITALLLVFGAWASTLRWTRWRVGRFRAWVTPERCLAQILVGFLKWGSAGLIIAVLADVHGVSLLHFGSCYCLAQLAAILSHSPGGLGVFDGTLGFLLRDRLSMPALAGALVLYRVLFNAVPFFMALPVLAGFEWRRRLSAPT